MKTRGLLFPCHWHPQRHQLWWVCLTLGLRRNDKELVHGGIREAGRASYRGVRDVEVLTLEAASIGAKVVAFLVSQTRNSGLHDVGCSSRTKGQSGSTVLDKLGAPEVELKLLLTFGLLNMTFLIVLVGVVFPFIEVNDDL